MLLYALYARTATCIIDWCSVSVVLVQIVFPVQFSDLKYWRLWGFELLTVKVYNGSYCLVLMPVAYAYCLCSIIALITPHCLTPETLCVPPALLQFSHYR